MIANFIRYKLFILRRERVISTIWCVAMVCGVAALAGVYPGLFPTQEALVNMQAGLNTPAMVAMMGPVYGMDALTPAIAMAQECLVWLALTLIVMNIFFVNRHTRVDEELGRHEMLVSLPVGRLTGSAITIVIAFGLNLIISLVAAFVLLALDIEGTTVTGAFCYAFSIGAQGFLFAAITLLAAQLFSTALGASGFSFALMGIFYLLRASGDMAGGNALSYLSPLGLGLRVEAFYTDAFWPVAILLVEASVIVGIAFVVGAKRDSGAGIIPARRGRAHASRFLLSPLGFAWRLVRKSFLIWAIAVFCLGASYGTVVGELDAFVEGNDALRGMLESIGGGTASLVESYVPMLSGIMGMLMCLPVIGAINRLRAEEKRGRLEQIYSKSVSRGQLFACFAAIAVAEACALTLLGALGLYATSAEVGLLSFETILASAFVQIPAILVVAGVAAVLLGLLPKLTALVWALVGYSFFMLYFGRIFDIPESLERVSPFGNVPLLPVEEFAATPVVVLCLLAAGLFAAGFVSYRRRDIG